MISRFRRRRRRTVPRRHAADALQEGCCMFAVHGNCDPVRGVVGLRGPDDLDAVVVCRLHLADLRRLRPYETERLARYLRVTFLTPPLPAAEREEGVRLVHVRAGVGSQ